LPTNPIRGERGIKRRKTQRNFLTLKELRALAIADCSLPTLKAAGLFSALTGLRRVDINKLKWGEIQSSNEQGYYIRFRQQKTDEPETLPISSEAVRLLGDRGRDDEPVFDELEKWQCSYYMPGWLKSAGIEKPFTFHCFRHTFATLQISMGTDIYTVSKMLGHTDLKTTEIYAKIVDQKKKEAANRISLGITF
jgi:integrase